MEVSGGGRLLGLGIFSKHVFGLEKLVLTLQAFFFPCPLYLKTNRNGLSERKNPTSKTQKNKGMALFEKWKSVFSMKIELSWNITGIIVTECLLLCGWRQPLLGQRTAENTVCMYISICLPICYLSISIYLSTYPFLIFITHSLCWYKYPKCLISLHFSIRDATCLVKT